MGRPLHRAAAGARTGTTLVLSIVLCTASAVAVETTDQQRCVNDMTKFGAAVAKTQNKENWICVKRAGDGQVDRLGTPPQQQTAQACLTNDVRGKVAKKVAKLQDRDASRCLANPNQLPDFGYAGGSAMAAAVETHSIGIVADLFGGNLDAAIVDGDADRDGAKCQVEVLKRTGAVFDDMWKVARTAIKDGLKGRNRLAGASPGAAAHSGANLQGELLAQVFADSKGKISGEAARLTSKTQSRCAAATTSLAAMFQGLCSASATLADLATCAEGIARGRFYASAAAFYGVDLDCDLTDNGQHDESCISDALRAHLLDRIGYGLDAYALSRIDALGIEGYIEEQLDPPSIPDSAAETLLANYPSLELGFQDLRDNYPQGGGLLGNKNDVPNELQESHLVRAIAGRRQLETVLTDFWFNHFNVAGDVGRRKWDTTPYVRESIRPNMLGSFSYLVLTMSRGPAMLDYLDNRRSQVGGINENFGRELLELHTMSVDGGYTETDVVEVARALTGWREDYSNEGPGVEFEGFEYRDSWHDQDPKTVLTLQIPANGGEQDGIDTINFISAHPSTADFISRKLILRFVAEDLPYALLDQVTTTFLDNANDPEQMKKVMRAILLSPEFLLYPEYRASKVKRPHVFFASMARATGADADPAVLNYNKIRKNVRDYGEELFNADPPTGYPDTSIFWTSPGTIIQRFNDAERVARKLDGFDYDLGVTGGTSQEIVDALIPILLKGGVSDETRNGAIAFIDSLPGPSDAERVEQATAYLLSSPEFLQH